MRSPRVLRRPITGNFGHPEPAGLLVARADRVNASRATQRAQATGRR
ncbi:hypothetical protein [Nonomuraea harbinensis]|uniref:Uncharacterized protein n=1 Tax=Nonomuraea harbinensis TaxID=1286938 RepID=A0ABW1C8E2_9ACTN|nr:hypothetical protein [Nonomuraea harbinensis]